MNGIRKEIEPKDNLDFVKLDLLNDDGWDDAVKDCDYVLHTASPFSVVELNDENEYEIVSVTIKTFFC